MLGLYCDNSKNKETKITPDFLLSIVSLQFCLPSYLSNCSSYVFVFFSYQKPKDFSYEEMSVTSGVSGASDSKNSTDESTFTSSFASFNDHIMCGCEDIWPDLTNYSPPASPVTRESESILSNDFPIETNAPNVETINPDAGYSPGNSRKPSDPSYSLHCNTRLLSPEIKLVPLCEEDVAHNRRKTSLSNGSACKRKSLYPIRNLVVKVEDIREKLKPRSGGGFSIVTMPAKGRFTISGRRIAKNYSEESLFQSSIKRAAAAAAATEAKKRKVRHKDQRSSRKKDKKTKHQRRNLAGQKNDALLWYENLKFSELKTVSRMSMRYKIAFKKWPNVFSGALDLINQRLTNQNAFWNSLGC